MVITVALVNRTKGAFSRYETYFVGPTKASHKNPAVVVQSHGIYHGPSVE
jgi:hypothetical protein